MSRGYLDTLHNEMIASGNPSDLGQFYKYGVYLLRCYRICSDQTKWTWYSQMLVKLRQQLLQEIGNNKQWQHLVGKIINLAVGE